MLAAAIPATMVATGDASPDLSTMRVGELSPGDCLALETARPILERHLAELRELINESEEAAGQDDPDPAGPALDEVREDRQVPMLCPQGNATAFRELVGAGNDVLRSLNQALAVLNRSLEEAQATVDEAGEIAYLLENFTAPRHGGLGEWSPQASRDKTGFREPIDPRVARGFALTDQPGEPYEHGLNTTLTFPAVDLGGAALDARLVGLPERVNRILEDQIPRSLGFPRVSTPRDVVGNQVPTGASSGGDGLCFDVVNPFTGGSQTCFAPESPEAAEEAYKALREAYIDTGDDLVRTWLTNVRAATLEVRHRFNLADGLDGVRYEVHTSPPPRHGVVPAGQPLVPREDSPRRGYEDVGSMGGADGFTTSSDGWVVERFDLSPWTGQRVWIVVRAVTSPAFGIPDFFQDQALFEDRSRFGYALGGAFVNGSALPHNLRVLEIDAGQIAVDGRPTVPPPLADQRVRVAVTNQGLEESPARVSLRQCQENSCTPWSSLGTVEMAPGEVRVLESPFPEPSVRGSKIRLEAQVEDPRETAPPDDRPEDNTRTQQLLVTKIPRVQVRHAPGTTLGLQALPDQGSPEEPRLVRLRVQNAGNVPLVGQAVLEVTNLETDRGAPTTVQDGAERTLRIPVGQARELTWKVVPSNPGVYRAQVHLDLPGISIQGPQPEVHLFAERSPSVVCADDFSLVRRCGLSWANVTDLPDEGERFRSVARGPAGDLFALHRNSSVLRFDGAQWTHVATASSARTLLTTSQGVLALGPGSTAVLVTRSGGEQAPSVPLSSIRAVASDTDGNAIVAGRASGGLGVAVGDGRTWETVVSREGLPRDASVDVRAVAPVGGDRHMVGVLEEDDDTGALTAALYLSPRVPGGSLGFERVARFPLDAAPGDEPLLGLAPLHNGTLVIVEHVHADHRVDLKGCAGSTCGFRIFDEPRMEDPVRPVVLPDDFQVEAFHVLSSRGWIEVPDGHHTRLYRADTLQDLAGVRAAQVPGTATPRGFGGGSGSTLAVVGQSIVEARDPLPHFANEGDWSRGAVLGPQLGDRVWTTVFDRESGQKWGEIRAASGTTYLRGTCAPPSNAAASCLGSLTQGADEIGRTIEDLNLTLRYNLRALGENVPEVRLIIETGATVLPRNFFLSGTAATPVGSPPYVIDPVDPSDSGETPLVDEAVEVRDPQVVAVATFPRATQAGWTTVTLQLDQALEQLRDLKAASDLLGVEFLFPRGTEMAIDAAWLNTTTRDHQGPNEFRVHQLLHTEGDGGRSGRTVGVWQAFPNGGVSSEASGYHDDAVKGDAGGSWQRSELTHRPAWAYLGPEGPDFELTAKRFDRLVTPVVDLRQAQRPALTFNHGYAFPPDAAGDPKAAGWLEVQIEQAPGQWSPWRLLRPEGGYGSPDGSKGDVDGYWGANVNRSSFVDFETLLDPENWETETFDLLNQTSVLVGKRVRFGFNTMVVKSGEAYEGWVLSDVRVTGTATPAVDLALEDVRFDEGYDVSETGLPPGGTVTLNATITNPGRITSAQGLSLGWELVGIGNEERILATGSTPLSTLEPGARTWVELPVRIPASFDRDLFPDSARGYLRVSLDPGSAVDEDPLNNVITLGTAATPFEIATTRDVEVRVDVSPERGSPDRPRLLDVRLVNTGNVPLTGIEVRRVIEQERGALGLAALPGQERSFVTDRELPAGEERSLARLVGGFGLDDRLWTPSRTGTFVISATAALDGESDHARRVAVAADPFLRSAVEVPTSGTATQGELVPGTGWEAAEPGAFGTARAWRFQPDPRGIAETGDAFTLETPPVDLSQAREATVSFIHNYDLEERFDGARLEASADGGETWRVLTPASTEPATGYADVLGGNPLADGNLSTPAFTGSSKRLVDEATEGGPGSDGWVLSTFLLDQLPGTREPGEIARMDMESLAGNSSLELPAPPADTGPEHVYSHASWLRGSVTNSELFMVENLTNVLEDRGPPGFLYTGRPSEVGIPDESATSVDEEVSAGVRFEIEVPELEADDRAVLDWWEWAPVQDEGEGLTGITGIGWFRGLHSPNHPAKIQAGEALCEADGGKLAPRLLEVDGYWRHYEVDVTDAGSSVTLVFQWIPWTDNGQERVPNGALAHQPGIVVDGLHLRTFRDKPSGEINPQIEWEEEWDQAERVYFIPTVTHGAPRCKLTPFTDGSSLSGPSPPLFREVDEIDPSRTPWEIVELPHEEFGTNQVLSSSPRSTERPEVFDASPYGDSRFVLPALDLSGAGDDVTLTFDHMPAFYGKDGSNLATGGVVEASVFDPATSQWGPWEQLYSKPNQLDADGKGGYTTFVPVYSLPGSRSPQALGEFISLPFEDHPVDPEDPEKALNRLVFLYNEEAWRHDERFDLSEFAGERVRLAFHAVHSRYCSAQEAYPEDADHLSTPGVEPIGRQENNPGAPIGTSGTGYCPDNGERWLIDNVTVNGQVFAGKPVQLRFVAGMDGSVHNATWLVDEIEVLGTSYAKNVGLYPEPGPRLVAPEVPATWEGVLRNLGTDVRRDLAVRATVDGVPAEVSLSLGGQSASGAQTVTSDQLNLPVGGQVPFQVDVTVQGGVDAQQATLRLELLQWNEALGTLTRVAGEQVRANLQRELPINVTDVGLTLRDLTVDPVRVQPGTTSTIEATLANPQVEGEAVRVACRVQRILTWEANTHSGDGQDLAERPVLSKERVPCQAQQPARLTVAAGEVIQRFETAPEELGSYLVQIDVFREGNDRNPFLEATEVLWVGSGPRALFESFEEDAWFSSGEANGWDNRGDWFPTTERAFRGNRSLLSGISTSFYSQGGSYNGDGPDTERLVTRPVDLHNVTDGRAHLSMLHMARLAFGDGADVQVRVLQNEGAPDAEGSWSTWCKLQPKGGYDGYVASFHVGDDGSDGGNVDTDALDPTALVSAAGDLVLGTTGDPTANESSPGPDYNPAYPEEAFSSDDPTGLYTRTGFFGTHNTPQGPVARWDESWQLATFPLHDEDGRPLTCGPQGAKQGLIGRTVQFAFTLYKGEPDGAPPTADDRTAGRTDPDPLQRGRGQGWFIDSVVVAAADTEVAPDEIRAPILDAAPKRFPVSVTNQGPATEYARVTVDRNRSTLAPSQTGASDLLAIGPDRSATGYVQVELPRDPLAIPFGHTLVGQAEGLLDPNQPASSTFHLDFDPRIWPDLAVEILEPSEPPVEGVPSIVPIRITNHGRAVSPPTQLVLHDLTLDEALGDPVQVPAIPPVTRDPLEATTAVFLPWTPPLGGPSLHELAATIDPEGLLEEFGKEDNRVTRTLEVQPLRLPDLAFDEANLTVQSPTGDVDLHERGTIRTFNVVADAPVTVEIPVLNRGSAPAVNIDVRLVLGNLPLPAKRIDRLDPGASSDVSFTFVAREGAREVQLEASSSSRDLVPGDNRAPLSGALNLVAETFRVDATGPELIELQEPGTVRDVTVTLENRGVRGVLLALSTQAPRGLSYDLETDRVFLGANDRAEIPGTVEVSPVLPGGTHRVAVTVQAVDDTSRTVETSVPVHLAERHALSATLAETTISPGPGQLDVQLANEGNLEESLTLVPTIDGTPLGPPRATTLPRDTTRTVSIALDVPAALPSGTHELTLEATGTHEERWTFEVDLSEMARPVVRSDEAGASFGPDGLTLPLILSNLGNLAANGELQVDPTADAPGARVLPSTVEIPAGGQAQARLVIPSPSGMATLPVVLRTDDGATTTTAVGLPQGRPDTRITQHSLEPTNPVPGEPSELRVTVANTGSVEAQNVPVDLFVNDEFALRTTVEALAAGASRTVSFQWPAFQGSHALMVVVNPGGEVPDEDPSNNAVTTLAQSQGSADALSRLTDGLREVPAPGFPLLLTALALALALLGRRPHRPGGSRP